MRKKATLFIVAYHEKKKKGLNCIYECRMNGEHILGYAQPDFMQQFITDWC